MSNSLKTFRSETLIISVCLAVSLCGAGLVFLGDVFNGPPSHEVILKAQGLSEVFDTSAETVGGFLDEIGLQYSATDCLEPPPDTPIQSGLVISFTGTTRVFLTDAGKPVTEIMCSGATVCDLLSEYGLDIRSLDRVVPHPSTPLEPDLHIQITRVEVVDVTNERVIEPGLVIEADPDLPRGRMVEVSAGSPGLAEEIIRYYYRNGEETARIEIGHRVVIEPIEKIARVGTHSVPILASRLDTDRELSEVMTMVATGYDPGPQSCWPYADGKTATGHIATKGVCAVDPTVIPLGTELWIEGYGYALACDTGGAIKGNRIDLCYDTRAEALLWGRREVLVYILE